MTEYVSKLGLDLDTSAFAKGEKAMDAFVKATDKLETGLDAVGASVDNAGKKAEKSSTSFEKQSAAVTKLAAASSSSDGAVRALASGIQAAGQAQARFLYSLQEQTNLLGKSQADILRYKAAQVGVGEAAEANIRKIEAFGAAQEAQARASLSAAKAVDTLASAIATVAAQQTSFLHTLNETADTIGKTQFEMLRYKAAQLGVADSAEAAIAKIEMANAASLNQAAASAAAARELSTLGSALQTIIGTQDRFLHALQEQSDLLGKSQADVMRYKAAQLGIGDAAEANIAKIEAFNAAAARKNGVSTLGTSAKLTANELMQVSYQMQDLGVQLASGQNPLTALVQQGSQLSNVFATAGARGIGFGGVIKGIIGSMGGLVVAAAPVILAIAAIGAEFALADREMRKGVSKNLTDGLGLTEKQLKRIKEEGASTAVTLGDSFKGLFDTLGANAVKAGNAILGAMGTSWAEVKKVVNDALDWLARQIGDNIAHTYGFFKGWFAALGVLFKNFPAVIGDAFVSGFNAAGEAAVKFINTITKGINSVITSVSKLTGLDIPTIPDLQFQKLSIQWAGQGRAVLDAFRGGFTSGTAEAKSAMSQFLADWAANSQKEGVKRLLKIAGDAGKQTGDAFGKGFKDVFNQAAFDADLAKGLYDATQKGLALVKRAIADINSSLADTAGKRWFLANADSIGDATRFKAALDYQQAVVNVMKSGQPYSQALVDDEYKRLTDARFYSETYDKIIAQKQRLVTLGSDQVLLRAMDGLTDASDNFWDDFVRGGKDAFSSLGNALQNIFFDVIADGLKAAFDPVLMSVKKSLSDILGNLFSGSQKTGSGLFDALGSIGKGASGGTSTSASLMAAFKTALPALSIAAVATLQPVVEKALGIKVENAWGKSGGMFGALGTWLGNIIGGGSTDATAGAKLTSKGTMLGGYEGGKRNADTTGALDAVISAIQGGYGAIQDLGGTIKAYVDGLSIGQRDTSQATLSNGQRVIGAVGDAADLANNALNAVLRAADFGTAALNKIRDGLVSAGTGFDDTLDILGKVKGVLDSTTPALSQWQQQLKTLKDTFDPLIAQTGAYSSALQDAYNTAKAALVGSFDNDISRQLLAANSNVAGQYADVLQVQSDRVKDATALGANLANVYALNAKETQNFIDGLSGSYSSIADLTTAFNALIDAAQKAGESTAPLTQAYEASKDALRSGFNADIQGQIDQLVNPTLKSLKDLLAQQKKDLESVALLGGNVSAVQVRNSLQTKQFFDQLTAEQKLSLGDYLGLIEDYTGKIGVVLAKLNDELTQKIDQFNETKTALQGTIKAFTDIAKSLSDTRNGIVDKYSAATPLARITDLRTQFSDLAGKAIGGDQAAAGQLPDLANKLIDLSRSLYGSTANFTKDYDLVTKLLGQAEDSATSQASIAQSQLDTLVNQYDMLVQIRDALSQPDPNLAFLQAQLGQLDSNNQTISSLLASFLQFQAAQAQSNFTASQVTTAASAAITQPNGQQPINTTDPSMIAQLSGAFNGLSEQVAAQAKAQAELETKIYQELRKLNETTAKAA